MDIGRNTHQIASTDQPPGRAWHEPGRLFGSTAPWGTAGYPPSVTVIMLGAVLATERGKDCRREERLLTCRAIQKPRNLSPRSGGGVRHRSTATQHCPPPLPPKPCSEMSHLWGHFFGLLLRELDLGGVGQAQTGGELVGGQRCDIEDVLVALKEDGPHVGNEALLGQILEVGVGRAQRLQRGKEERERELRVGRAKEGAGDRIREERLESARTDDAKEGGRATSTVGVDAKVRGPGWARAWVRQELSSTGRGRGRVIVRSTHAVSHEQRGGADPPTQWRFSL